MLKVALLQRFWKAFFICAEHVHSHCFAGIKDIFYLIFGVEQQGNEACLYEIVFLSVIGPQGAG